MSEFFINLLPKTYYFLFFGCMNDDTSSFFCEQNPLEPIYQKVTQLRLQQTRKEAHQQPKIATYNICQVPNSYYQIKIDRQQEFFNRKIKGLQLAQADANQPLSRCLSQDNRCSNKKQGNKVKKGRIVRSKSSRLKNFLMAESSKNLESPKPARASLASSEPAQRQVFTPLQSSPPLPKLSEASITSRLKIQKIIGNCPQIARLSQTDISKPSTPSQYLRKGERVRQTLRKNLQFEDESIDGEAELAYVREYDQWVPSSLISHRKTELQNHLNLILGGKKSEKKTALIFDPFYL